MRTLKLPLIFSLIILPLGCAVADFTPYEGQQANWPIAVGGLVKNDYAVPVYFGPPSKAYEVIGYLDAKTAPVRRQGVVAFAARRAKEIGGEAIIVLEEGKEYAGTIAQANSTTSANTSGTITPVGNHDVVSLNTTARTSTSAYSIPLFRGSASVIVIRFRPGTARGFDRTNQKDEMLRDLLMLKDLKDAGIISDAEFVERRNEILDGP